MEEYNKSKKEAEIEKKAKKGDKSKRNQPKVKEYQIKLKPTFLLAHELYDALPIHSFKYLGDKQWCEQVI